MNYMHTDNQDKYSDITKPFSSKQAAALSGLTTDMVNYIIRYKIITPTGKNKCCRGKARKFTFSDVLLLRVIAKLLKNGVSVLRLRKSILALQKRGGKYKDILTKKYVATDGQNIYFKDDGILQIFETGQTAFAFVLELGSIRAELEDIIENERKAV
jgi:DNA-binding transcriptional MerR regulator